MLMPPEVAQSSSDHEIIEIDEKNAHLFYRQVNMPLVIYDFAKYFLLACGSSGTLFCLISTIVIVARDKCKPSDEAEIESSSEANEATPLLIE